MSFQNKHVLDVGKKFYTAEKGNQKTQFNLDLMYDKCQGMEESFEVVINWFRAAVEQSYAKAQSNLGSIYAQDQIKVYTASGGQFHPKLERKHGESLYMHEG
ncbi:hypothetical protein G9A89_022992 [Geosiphon pyriformis]|nr:hypothetical protein G9A89_022992 [Geosiphon pyriformis]